MRRHSKKWVNIAVTRNAFKRKGEVIDLAAEDAAEASGGEDDSEDDGECAEHIWLKTSLLTDESDDEDDEEGVAEVDNLFDDLPLANQRNEIQTNILVKYSEKVKLWKSKGTANNQEECANGMIHNAFSWYVSMNFLPYAFFKLHQ